MSVAFNPGEVNANDDREVILKSPTGANLFGAATSANSVPVVLPTDITPVPMRTLAEQALKDGKLFAVADFTSFTSTSFFSKLLIRNPAASGVNLTVLQMEVNLIPGATTSQVNFITMRLRKNPTFSALGTLLTINNLKFDDAGPASAEVYELPTPTSTGTIIDRPASITGTIKTMPFIIQEGEDVLIQISVNDINNDAYIRLMFIEDAP